MLSSESRDNLVPPTCVVRHLTTCVRNLGEPSKSFAHAGQAILPRYSFATTVGAGTNCAAAFSFTSTAVFVVKILLLFFALLVLFCISDGPGEVRSDSFSV